MAETKKKTTKKASDKTASKKVDSKAKKANTKTKATAKKETKKVVKAEEVKEVKKVEVKKEEKKEKVKKECKLVTWFKKLTLEQLVIGGVIIIAILLIILIGVTTKNTKTKDGKDIVAKIDGKTITADDLYTELKASNGTQTVINLIDLYLLDKEYKTTDEMKESAKSIIENYKTQYGDEFEYVLTSNGYASEKEFKEAVIRSSKMQEAIDAYIEKGLTEKQMKEYYEKNIYGDISAKHILITPDVKEGATEDEKKAADEAALNEAKALIERIKNGEDFSTLAKEFSDDEGSKEKGGDLGYFNTGDMVEEFEKAAFALEKDQYTTEPVKTNYGYHIIMKTGAKEKPSYKKAKDTVIEKLIEETKASDASIYEKTLISLRKKYNLTIKDKTVKKEYDERVKEATATTTTTKASK